MSKETALSRWLGELIQRGIKRITLAHALDVPPRTLDSWRSGALPNGPTYVKVCDTLTKIDRATRKTSPSRTKAELNRRALETTRHVHKPHRAAISAPDPAPPGLTRGVDEPA